MFFRLFMYLLGLSFLLRPSSVDARRYARQGFVDLRSAIDKVCDGRSAQQRLRHYRNKFQRQINGKQSQFRRLKKKYDKKGSRSRQGRRKYSLLQLRRFALNLRKMYTDLRKYLVTLESMASNSIIERMRKIIHKVAKKNRLIFVFEKGKGGLLYAHPSRNFTKQLIKLYNRKYCIRRRGKLYPKKSNKFTRTLDIQFRKYSFRLK